VPVATAGRLRWAILGLLFAAAVLNYVDRQALSILATKVQQELGIDDLGYARIVQYFLFAYSVSYLGAGWLTDRLGARLALALYLGWWSVANMATGLVRGAGQLGFARAMLGLGEPGVYTAGPKAIGEHFEPAQRGLAFGLYTAGAMVGATLAPPLVGGLALAYGWRTAFVVTGSAGLLLLVTWLFVYPPAARGARRHEPIAWGPILKDPSVWSFAAARLIADPVWYFYLFWFPKYLTDERGLSLLAVAQLAWIVYLASDIGSAGGGWFSGWLIRRGRTPPKSRLVAIGIGCALAPMGMAIAAHPGLGLTLALGALVAFAHMVFQVNMGALIIDVYPQRIISTIFGVLGAASGLGGIVSTQLVGKIVNSGSYDRVFLIMAVLHPIACGIVWGAVALRGTLRTGGADVEGT
jgi:ACS family hexuronate transporter-like MFS transporter